ncbi:zinc ribbon domain-containing protein [Chloroflexota bacterium]
MSVVRQLYQLQLVDTDLVQQGNRLVEVERALVGTGDVARAQQAVDETEGALGGLAVRLRDVELEIAGLNAKLKQNQDRLYSGRVKNPKELSGLDEEAAALRRRRSELEDDQLELMIEIEEQEAELAERQARLQQIDETWRANKGALLDQREGLQSRIGELTERRDDMRAEIGPGDLVLYDDIRGRLGGTAVVMLRRGVCQACGVDLPTGAARSVERSEGLHFCPTCDRLLYGGG